MIKKTIITLFFSLCFIVVNAQTISDKEIHNLKQQLDSLEKTVPALSKNVNSNINNVQLPMFIRTIADLHNLNISVNPILNPILVTHNFSNVSVKEVLLFSAKKYNLDIRFLGKIITINKKQAPVAKPKELLVFYNHVNKVLSLDLKNDDLNAVFKKITQLTGKNIFYTPNLSNRKLTIFLKELDVFTALKNIANTNNLHVKKTQKGLYQFTDNTGDLIYDYKNRRSVKSKNFYFKVVDTLNKIIDVDINKVSIATVVNELGLDLKANMFTTAALPNNETTSFKANNIHFDTLLTYIFETTKNYSFKKENNIYFFGKDTQKSIQSNVIIPLLHRTIQILNEPKSISNNSISQNQSNFSNRNGYTNGNSRFTNGRSYSNANPTIPVSKTQDKNETNVDDLLNLIPESVRDSLEIKSDVEHNSFNVSGPYLQIEKFRDFVKKIDKPVPFISIDIMILEVSNSASVSTGIELGLGEQPTTTKGSVFPNADLTLGANSINKIISGLNGFGSLNLGKVNPNFYAKIHALETNGDLDIKSTPTISALNGHEANFSNGERSYYVETITDIIGSQNPQTREIKNYIPVDAHMAIKIIPIVSGDGEVTLSIKVIQSSFNGKKIDPEAPPGINSREFTSTIRVNNNDVVILGGLEENLKNDSGSGVPFLARIPIIKYLFSKRTRTASKSKLSVLIKPTIIRSK